MKELQNVVTTYLLDREKHKKYLAVLTALSILVSFVVPFILMRPADSMTKNSGILSTQLARATASDGVEIVTDEQQKVTLLIGENKPEIRGNTVEETLTLARSKYLLGIASQFGVFLQGDFTCHRADVESRLAIGGSANLSDLGGLDGEQWGFEIANGDFESKVSLEYLTNNWGYADAIVQGDTFTRIITKSHDYYKPREGENSVLLDKTFVISPNITITDYPTYYTYVKQNDKFIKSAYTPEPFRKMDTPLIDFQKEFELMQTRSNKLASIEKNGNLYFSKNSDQTGFSYDGSGSDDLSNENANNDSWTHWNIAHFVYEGEPDGTIAYFNISKEEWDILSKKCRYISYEGIPEGANIIVSVEGEEIDFSLTQFVFINGVHISNNKGGKPFNYRGTYISNQSNGGRNNHESCEQLLYNFHDATSVTLYNNIAGNVYAPFAHVDTVNNPNNPDPSKTDSSGHLSGALVALSFEGSFEFGYRPYQGTIDLLGSTSGYTIPMNKFKAGEPLTHLAGAQFALYEGDKIAESFITGDSTQMFTVPTKVDYDGNTNYRDVNGDITTTYTLKEQSPPNGYVADDKTYTVVVHEVVDTNTLHELENGNTLPTQVTVQLQIIDDTGVLFDTGDMIIKDFYSEEAQTRREINANGETFLLTLDNGKITAVAQPTGDVEELIEEEEGTTYIETEVTEVYSFVESSYDSVQTNVKVEIELEDGSTSVIETDDYYDVFSSEVKYSDAPSIETISSETIYENITQETVTKPISPVAKETFTVTNEDGSETKTFYYDPDSLMMMPYPNSIPQFINEYGLVFHKIGSDTQNPLSDAKIELQKLNADGTYQTIAELTGGTNIIDVKNDLEIDAMYRFYERVENTPNGYETAAPIYFKKTSEYVIEYADDPSAGPWTELKLAEGNNTIQMTDQKIVGAKLVLKKVESGTPKLLNGAKFDLYKDGTAEPIVTGIELTNGELNLYEAWKDVSNDCIERGYLKEGVYYLKEVSPPNGYEAGDDIYFSVKSTDGGYGIELGKPKTVPFTIEYKANGQQAWANGAAVNVSKIVINVTGPEGIQRVKLYNGKLNNECTGFNGETFPVVNGKVTIENVPDGVLGNLEIQNADKYENKITVSSVEVYGDPSDGSSSGGTTDNNVYYIFNYADGTSSAEQSFTGKQLQSFSINTSNVTSVTFRLPKGKVASYFEVYKDWWNDDNRNKKTVSQTANTVTVDLGGASSGIMQLYVDGIAVDENASSEPEETPPAETPETDDAIDAKVEENGDELIVTIGNSKAGQKTSITVQKNWSVPEGYNELPTEIEVTLYKAKDANKTEAVKVETVELNAANEWKKTWSNLDSLINPASTDENAPRYYYYVEETTVKGYETKITNNNVTSGTITITNKLKTTSHTVIKKWSTRPHPTSIQVKLQYSTNNGTTWNDAGKTAILSEENSWTATFEDLPSEGRIYQVVEPNVPNGWTGKETTDGDTTTITNTLKTGKLQITKRWEDNDITANRPQKVKVNVYRTTIAPSDEEDEEIEYEVTNFLYQKGDGGTDHSYWGSPEAQSSRVSQMLDTTNSASDIAADYAAALAQYAVNFPNDAKSGNYLKVAKELYEFSTKYNSRTSNGTSGFYWDGSTPYDNDPGNSNVTGCSDEQAWAAAWLYLATNDSFYKTECESKLADCVVIPDRGHFWNDVALGAEIVYASHVNDDSNNTTKWNKVEEFLNTYCKEEAYRVLDGWGSTRHNTLLQMAALATDKNRNRSEYQEWCKKQMAFILGNNSIRSNNNSNTCFVVGFAENSSKYPHHRAASCITDWNTWNNSDGTYPSGHSVVGALVAGPDDNGNYGDTFKDAVGNEVAIDYNAGLVGAAAGLYSVYGTGSLVYNEAEIDASLEGKYDGFTVTRYPNNTGVVTEDYSRLLQYSLYFYDANMCGDDAGENSAISWRGKCHTDDPIDGGFHDAGDHVMFGLPQGFTASTLGWAYYEFKDSFDSLGQTAHYKTIMEEFCDFFVDSTTLKEVKKDDTLTANADLPQANSKKATAIKGITVMNGENVAKAVEKTITLQNYTGAETSYNLDLQEITKIEIVYSFVNKNGAGFNFALNDWGIQLKPDQNAAWDEATQSYTFTHNFSNPTYIKNLVIKDLWNASSANIVVTFHSAGAPSITINGAESYEKFVGETIDLTATPATAGNTVTWSVTTGNDVVSVDPNTGKVTTLKAGDAVITATETDASGQVVGTDTVSIKVKDVPLGITANPTQIHVDGKTTLSITPDDATITQKSGTEFADYDPAKKTVTGKAVGDAVFEVSKNGNTASLTIKVTEALSITGGEFGEVMDLGTQQTLTANNIGTLTWTSTDENVLKVVNGVVTAEGVGTATITATDADGATKGYTITVQMAAVKPTLPETKEWVKTVELDKADNWTKLENLPMYDANGKRYYYYIEEVLEGDSLAGSGGAVYMPIDYSDNNGSPIEEEQETELTVTNMLTEVTQGSMPSAGGEGTKWYYVIGMMLMLTGITTGIVTKRRQNSRR